MPDAQQAPSSWDKTDIMSLFDPATGVLDRRVLSDEQIYKLELERIFARGWNFMCHESQIPKTGDYFINYIGEDQVIVVRDDDGNVNVLLNSCRHRGNALCRSEQGHAKNFVCSYHGWNYALDGRLVAVPGEKTYYRSAIDRSRLGLVKAARVESYLGFFFATMDPDAPSLHDYLGEVGRTGLGMVCAYGEVEVIDGVQKNMIDCNWKIAVDNLFDWYHVMFSHASAGKSGILDLPQILHPNEQLVMLSEYGHAISGPAMPKEMQARVGPMTDDERDELSPTLPPDMRVRHRVADELMGPTGVRSIGHPNIFPNLWITLSGMQMCLRLPRGASRTELWWFTVVPKNSPPQLRQAMVRLATHMFGPAGMLEQDDGENWSQSTRTSRGVANRKVGHQLVMGLGHDEVVANDRGEHYIETCINEHGQRWFYRGWTEWMAATSWKDLEANHSPLPQGPF